MSPVKLLRFGVRALPRPQRLSSSFSHSRNILRQLQTDASPQRSSSRPLPSQPYQGVKIDLSKAQWAESIETGSHLKVHTTAEESYFENTGRPKHRLFPALFLRDACACPRCVDSSSTQKNFSTTEIPLDIKIKSMECTEEGVELSWENDIPGFEDNHTSSLPRSLLDAYLSKATLKNSLHETRSITTWKRAQAQKLKHFQYEAYMNDDKLLFQALRQLDRCGFIILDGVPENEKSVEDVAGRIGTLRDTFYGRTWNVKSTPQAKNVAYTQQYLGLHMDLLYMHNPPGFQFLHCLKNSCEGGSSLLSDSFNTVHELHGGNLHQPLDKIKLAYHYKNDGQYYYNEHDLVEPKQRGKPLNRHNIKFINYSPPFQAPIPTGTHSKILESVTALKAFTEISEAEENTFEYRLNEGECVIFNNRRVLHGRRQFDATSGERWLKGCYVDTDVFESRLRVLYEADSLKPEAEI